MANSRPLISVVIPHLNQPEHLRRCLASLRDQSYPRERTEVIVVDNGSVVLPEEVCRSFGGVHLDREATPGPGPARNRGVALSSGTILAFIDADCKAKCDWLAIIADAFEDPAQQVIGGDVRIALENLDFMTPLEAYESIFAYRQREYIERQNFSGTGNLAMSRKIYDAVGPFAGIEVAEDREWGHRATAQGYHICYVQEMIAFHPARKSFAELRAKWDRHLSHDFEEHGAGIWGRLRWLALAFAMFGSPLLEIPRILCSNRVTTFRERCMAAKTLIRIRGYRAIRMLALLLYGPSLSLSASWNRR